MFIIHIQKFPTNHPHILILPILLINTTDIIITATYALTNNHHRHRYEIIIQYTILLKPTTLHYVTTLSYIHTTKPSIFTKINHS